MEGAAGDVPRRVIVHIDMDCFYAQVEQNRLGIPRTTPCAVLQWDSLVAVNYAARGRGVVRFMRAVEARKVCPELKLVHVRIIGEGGVEIPDPEGSMLPRGTAKACLQRYRKASGQVKQLLRALLRGHVCPMEKVGMDEMFVDVTAMAEAELAALSGGAGPHDGEPEEGWQDGPGSFMLHGLASDSCSDVSEELSRSFGVVEGCSVVVGGPLRIESRLDGLLVAGALIAQRMRRAIFSQLQMTSSAGIAHNKVLAKLGSSLHKPDKQVLVLPRGVRDMMQRVPVDKIWGLGGKLGAAVATQLEAATAGEAQLLSLQLLSEALGPQQAASVYGLVRGQSSEPVVEKSLVKSMISSKNFGATSDLGSLEKLMGIMAEELALRLAEDHADNLRHARTLTLHYRGGPAYGGQQPLRWGPERSVRCRMPQPLLEDVAASAAQLAASAVSALRGLPDAFPCIQLSLTAGDFTVPPAASCGGGRSIGDFFSGSMGRPGGEPTASFALTLPSPSGQSIREEPSSTAPGCAGRAAGGFWVLPPPNSTGRSIGEPVAPSCVARSIGESISDGRGRPWERGPSASAGAPSCSMGSAWPGGQNECSPKGGVGGDESDKSADKRRGMAVFVGSGKKQRGLAPPRQRSIRDFLR